MGWDGTGRDVQMGVGGEKTGGGEKTQGPAPAPAKGGAPAFSSPCASFSPLMERHREGKIAG
jgi:hypothetical protein